MAWLRAEPSGDLINTDHVILITVVPKDVPFEAESVVCAALKVGDDDGDYVVTLYEGDQKTCENVRDAIGLILTEGMLPL